MMEARLWWIGVAMGLYAYLTRYGARSGRLEARGATAAWHGLFCALAAFALTLIAVMSLETRVRFQGPAAGILSLR